MLMMLFNVSIFMTFEIYMRIYQKRLLRESLSCEGLFDGAH